MYQNPTKYPTSPQCSSLRRRVGSIFCLCRRQPVGGVIGRLSVLPVLLAGLLRQLRVYRPFHLNPQGAEAFSLTDKITTPFAEFVHRLSIAALRLIQTLPQRRHIIDKQAHFVVQPRRAVGNALSVLALVLIAPQVGDGTQRHQQRRRADQHEPHQTTLRIAIECHSCIQWLTPALDNFRLRYPQVVMDFKSGVTFDPQPALQQGELDLVMTSDILPRSGLHYSPMFDFEVRLVLAPDHPLAGKPQITPEDLSDETLMIYPVQRQRLDIWRHFLQPAGISPALKSVDNTLLLIQMVAARMPVVSACSAA